MSRHSPTTNRSLVLRLCDRTDADARLRFTQRYRLPLLEFAQSRGFHTIDLEGAVHETLIRALTALPQGLYDPSKGRFRDWLLGILKNQLRQAIRAEASRHRRERRYATDIEPDLHATPSDAALWRKACLRQALRILFQDPTLQGRTLAVFRDYSLRGLPVRDVAEAYGLTPNAVHQIRSRLTIRLRAIVRALITDLGHP